MERSEVPAGLQQNEPITEPQLSYIEGLIAGKDLSPLLPEQRAWLADFDMRRLTKKQATRVISQLKECPWAARDNDSDAGKNMPEVRDGRYAIPKDDGTLMFYSVKKGTYLTFVDVWASDARYPIKALTEKRRILEAIAADPDAGPRFGREIGSCYVCGRTLTDELSRQLGIGPICRAKA